MVDRPSLHKKSALGGSAAPRTATPRHVHFTPPSSISEVVPSNTLDTTLSLPLINDNQQAHAQTATPQPGERKKRKSLVARLFTPRPAHSRHSLPPPLSGDTHWESPLPDPSARTSTSTTETPDSWHHYENYFPTYEPVRPPASANNQDGDSGHDSYFPDYTPILSASHPLHAYPGTSSAVSYALSPHEAERAAAGATIGRSVHLPDLPRFAEYQVAATTAGAKGGSGWQAGKWGVEGWTGYSWAGEKLPDNNGLSFGAPMPPGVQIPKEGEKKKKGDGGGEGGEENEQAGQSGQRGEGEEGEGEGGGQGGSSGKTKKKKKK
ncbi:hypothetical protein DB88DRAFT_543639 [Papiliotrema laurentii]|uniref:Uncharacterized protein n=1 Tax=Papiliotrema laurentii TaxID=5418 RepID=A0AAD9L8N6_PAPLA|nr:hypothetical protein DB88DRAFT_543639 [Papiliotrema laurentii]